MNPTNTTTLRQRRAGIKPTREISKRRLESKSEEYSENKETSTSTMKSIIIFLLMLTVVVVCYMALKAYLTNSSEGVEVTPTVTVSEGLVISTQIEEDSLIVPLADKEYWNLEAKKIVASSESTSFEIKSLLVQPHKSYISFNFEVTGGNEEDYPATIAQMTDNLIIEFENTSLQKSVLEEGEISTVDSAVAKSIGREMKSDNKEKLKILLSSEQTFAMYTKMLTNKKYIILEVAYPTVNSTLVPTVTAVVSPTNVMNEGQNNLTNDYSKNEQKISSDTNQNVVRINKYNYEDSSEKFTYNLLLSDGIPNAVAKIDGNNLVVTISNLAFDGVVGNGGSGSTDLAATGVSNLTLVSIENSNNTSVYTFTLDAPREYRISVNEEQNLFTIEVKN